MALSSAHALRQVVTTFGSQSKQSTRLNALRLYRYCIKSIPFLQNTYKLQYTKRELRNYFRHRFDEQKHVKDLNVAEMLIWRGEMDLEEALNVFKTKSHVVRLIKPVVDPQRVIKENNFLHDFFDKFEKD